MNVVEQMLNSLSLRTRIYLSAGLLVGICCIASGIGWFGQTVLLANIDDYEQSESLATEVLEIDRNIQELKAQAENHIHTGTQSTRRAADRLLEQLATQIQETQQQSESDELADLLQEMELHLKTFAEQLELASRERSIRTSLLNDELPAKADEVQAAIGTLKRSISQSDVRDASPIFFEVMNELAESRKQLLRYLIDPGADQFDRMLAALELAEAQVDAIDVGDSEELRAERILLSTRLREFQQLSLRAVQATRGYLYYTNVVMAGEISEFVYYSNQVKKFVDDQQQLNRTARSAAANRTRTLSVIAMLTSVMLAGLLAAGLSYSILRPVSMLTQAFRRLSEGETLKDIPGMDRQDEIGRMSQAAHVFSARNQETQDLLTQSQSLTAELAEKAKALEETNLELDNFAYVASHDLKAPLRGINSLAEWVQEDCGELLPEESQRHLRQMQDRVQKMDTLLNDLLVYSRVGRVAVQTEKVDLQELVESVIDMADNTDGVQIKILSPLPSLRTAIAPLKQVILNLVTNAIKYNDKGSQGEIEIDCHDHGDKLSISVADNGRGIDPRYHQRIFQMYQRISPKEIDGSGMGLAMVKKQVECHGGEISVQSIEGQGATFTFTWPKEAVKLGAPELVGGVPETVQVAAGGVS